MTAAVTLVCMAVPFFMHHYTSDVMRVHSLVSHFSWGHISVRVLCVCVCMCVCITVPFFCKIIPSDLIWLHSLVCLFVLIFDLSVSFPGATY